MMRMPGLFVDDDGGGDDDDGDDDGHDDDDDKWQWQWWKRFGRCVTITIKDDCPIGLLAIALSLSLEGKGQSKGVFFNLQVSSRLSINLSHFFISFDLVLSWYFWSWGKYNQVKTVCLNRKKHLLTRPLDFKWQMSWDFGTWVLFNYLIRMLRTIYWDILWPNTF